MIQWTQNMDNLIKNSYHQEKISQLEQIKELYWNQDDLLNKNIDNCEYYENPIRMYKNSE